MTTDKRAPRPVKEDETQKVSSPSSETNSLINEPAGIQPIATDGEGVSRLTGISRSHWYRLVATGRAPVGFRLGKSRRWMVEEIRTWLAAGAPPRDRWEAMQAKGGQ